MSKKIFLANASCMNGILQALCHIRFSQYLLGFPLVCSFLTVAWGTACRATVAL
jgi:hypothetical protein